MAAVTGETVGRLIAALLTFPGSGMREGMRVGQRAIDTSKSVLPGEEYLEDAGPQTEEAKRGVITGNATIPAPCEGHESRKTSSGALSSPCRVSKCAGL